MPSLEIVTFGCRLNAYESEVIRARASDAGLRDAKVPDDDGAVVQLVDAFGNEDGDEELVRAAEVQIDRAGGDPRRACDVGDLRVEVAALGEDVGGGAENQIALRDGGGVPRA